MNYVVKDGAIVIVDEFTGRLMEGRQWSDGLHQAVEAKEGVKIKEETQTLATITLQNFFKLYDKICGMTGTAMTEAERVLEDLQAGRDRHSDQPADCSGLEHPDVIYLHRGREIRWRIADEIERLQSSGTCWSLKDGERYAGTIHQRKRGRDRRFSRKDEGSKETIPRQQDRHDRTQRTPDSGRYGLDRKERTAVRTCWSDAASSTRC